MNTFIGFFKFIIILLVVYIGAIFLICRFKKCDVKTSLKLFWNFCLNCFDIYTGNPSDTCCYPVFIGIDDAGFPHADIIENVFNPLSKDFESFYFHNCAQNQNRLFYYFRAELPKKEMTPLEMMQYTQKKCDSIVHQFMHRINPQIPHAEFLVVTNYIDNILTVGIAKNKTGTVENNRDFLQLREQYMRKNISRNNIMEEEWDDETDNDKMGL